MSGKTIPEALGALIVGRSLCLPDNVEWVGVITDLLMKMCKPYYWNPNSGDVNAAVTKAREILYNWLDQLCEVDMEGVQYRRKPNTNDYTLQVKIGAGEWEDTEYSFVGAPIIQSTMWPVVTDEHGDTVGTFTKLPGANPPGTQVISDTYSLELSSEAFQGGKGDPGDPGIDGKSIEFDSTPSVPVDPNQDPEIVITGETDTVQTVQAKLPRAPTWTVGDVLPLPPGDVPTVDINPDDNGDLIVDFGLVKGDKGDTGLPGTGFNFDDTEPEPGETVEYPLIVEPDGTVFPIRLKENDVLAVFEQAKGLWGVTQRPFSTGDYVTDESGVTIGAATEVGKLVRLWKLPGDAAFGDEQAYTAPVTATQDGVEVVYRQKASAGFIGFGALYVVPSLYRPNPTNIIGEFDFRTGHHGWGPVEFDNRWSNEYGGIYEPNGGINVAGFYPTDNVYEGKNSTIRSPQFPTTAIHSIDVIFDQLDGNGAYMQVWGKPSNSGAWEIITPTVEVHSTDTHYPYLLPVAKNCIYLAVTMSNYQHSSTTWRFFKVIVA